MIALARPILAPILAKGAELLAKSKFASKATDAALVGMGLSAGVDALTDTPTEGVDPAAAVAEPEPSSVQIARMPNGHIRVSFASDSAEAPQLDTALSAFSDGIATTDRDSGKNFKVYTLTPREFERLHAEGSL